MCIRDRSIAGRFGGTGLGMTITKEIIELMGGSISVRSQLGKGSVFVLSLPYTENTEEAFEEDCNHLVDQLLEDAQPEETNYSRLKILVADDNATNHMVVMSLIDSLVAEVHLASDGQLSDCNLLGNLHLNLLCRGGIVQIRTLFRELT